MRLVAGAEVVAAASLGRPSGLALQGATARQLAAGFRVAAATHARQLQLQHRSTFAWLLPHVGALSHQPATRAHGRRGRENPSDACFPCAHMRASLFPACHHSSS